MDTKNDRYNLQDIPDKHWDALPADVKKAVDKDIEAKLKGNIKPPEKDTPQSDRRSDIA
jgi:hypothetical protein